MLVFERERPIQESVQRVYKFDNGYGASVIKGKHTYGGSEGLWELAVIQWNEDNYELTYDTPITDDVIGYLTEDKVKYYLKQIEELKGDNSWKQYM